MNAKEAAARLRAADDILIILHKDPDGDTVGGGFALWKALKAVGKRARVVCSDKIGDKYRYLSGEYADDEGFEPAYIVAVDIAAPSLVGEPWHEAAKRADLGIDHHGSNELYAKETLLDASSASCCELIAEIIDELGVPFDEYIASALYTGVSTDTGCFRYRNTTPASHRFAARLIECGIDLPRLNRVLFEQKSRERVMLEQLAIAGIEFAFGGRVAIIAITNEMMRRSGAKASDVEGITPLPRSIEGVDVGVTVRELPSGAYKFSLRTGEIDAAKVCAAFGGGGHHGAAGFECTGELADIKALLLAEIARYLG